MKEVNQKLLIRVDVTTQTGIGHFMRCLALAQEWQSRGGRVTFLVQYQSDLFRDRLIAEDMDIIHIEKSHPDPHDIEITLSTLDELRNTSGGISWCVVDGYHFDSYYQKAVQGKGYRLLVIDDTNHLPCYYADIILNQNIVATELQYHCSDHTHRMLGPSYALLRKEFVSCQERKRETPDIARRILITFGGADTKNVTLKTVQALKLAKIPDMDAVIVLGPANRYREQIEEELNSAPFSFHLFHSTDLMSDLMTWADIAVSAGGITSYELAFMGVPNIAGVLSENQLQNIERLHSEGVLINIGWHHCISVMELAKQLEQLSQDAEFRTRMSQCGRKLVDGQGARRICDEMIGKE